MVDVPIALQFVSVSFSYPALDVLEDVSFHFHSGEFIALVGPNGSGKTTLLKLILGLEQPQKGAITLLGQNPKKSSSLIGYVPQHASYDPTFPITVQEVVRMGMWHRQDAVSASRSWSKPYGLLGKWSSPIWHPALTAISAAGSAAVSW
jgi:ABC-type Mn2+/Zn2+ transport system ATPase subunit